MPPPWALPRGPPVHGLPAQPVVEVCDQPALAPAAEEGADPTPAGKVRGHRPPRDPARGQVTDHVQQLPVTVTLGRSAPPPKPGRHRQQRPDGRPFRVRHCRRDTGVPGPGGRPRCRTRARGDHTIVQPRWTGGVRRRTTTTSGPPGTARLDSHPRATERPRLHTRTTGRSPRRKTCSTHTFRDRFRYGF